MAKPGWQRRKHDEKKEIPDKLKYRADSNFNDNSVLSLESEEEVIDLSLAASKGHHHRLIMDNMTPPKKRRFELEPQSILSKHVTLPPR